MAAAFRIVAATIEADPPARADPERARHAEGRRAAGEAHPPAEAGLSRRSVARALEVPNVTVYSWLKAAGVGPTRAEWQRRIASAHVGACGYPPSVPTSGRNRGYPVDTLDALDARSDLVSMSRSRLIISLLVVRIHPGSPAIHARKGPLDACPRGLSIRQYPHLYPHQPDAAGNAGRGALTVDRRTRRGAPSRGRLQRPLPCPSRAATWGGHHRGGAR